MKNSIRNRGIPRRKAESLAMYQAGIFLSVKLCAVKFQNQMFYGDKLGGNWTFGCNNLTS